MFRKNQDDKANQYIRERIKQARLDADKTQDEVAFRLGKTRVTVSDIERGRVSVNASDLALIAAFLDKPISYFFPPMVSIGKDDLTKLDEELVHLFHQLPENQQYIALEYVRQQVDIADKAFQRKLMDDVANNDN